MYVFLQFADRTSLRYFCPMLFPKQNTELTFIDNVYPIRFLCYLLNIINKGFGIVNHEMNNSQTLNSCFSFKF